MRGPFERKRKDALPEPYVNPTRAEIPLKLTRDKGMQHNPAGLMRLGSLGSFA
jgi:hypothetical protein